MTRSSSSPLRYILRYTYIHAPISASILVNPTLPGALAAKSAMSRAATPGAPEMETTRQVRGRFIETLRQHFGISCSKMRTNSEQSVVLGLSRVEHDMLKHCNIPGRV